MPTPLQRENVSPTAIDKPRTEVRPATWLNISEAVLLGAAVSLTVFALQWRYGFNLGDEGWLWYASQRTALGEIPFRDFFSYDPGRYYWSAAIFKLLGRNGFYEQLLANYLFAIIGLALAYFAMLRARVRLPMRIAMLILLGVVIGFPRHKIYEQTLSLIAVAAIAFVFAAPQKINRWFSLGLVIGLAAFFGRNSGVFCAIATVVAFVVLHLRGEGPRPVRTLAALASGTVMGYSPMIVMLVAVHGFAKPFFQSVLMTPKWAWSLPIPFPWHVHLRGLTAVDRLQARTVAWLCVAVPLTYAVALGRALRSQAKLDNAERLSVAASAAGVGFLVHAFYTADFFHIAEGVVPFVIAAGALSVHWWGGRIRRRSAILFGGMAFLVLASWLPMEPLVQCLRARGNTPGKFVHLRIDGRGFLVPSMSASIMQAVATAFHNCGGRDGGFLAAPYYPGLYAFLNTRAPSWDTYYLWPRSDQIQQAEIDDLQRDRTSLFLLNPTFAINGRENLEFARTNPKLLGYIESHYQRAEPELPDGFKFYYSLECGQPPGKK
jgi:xanthosine utilization system XapX-like protein